jgi:uncharacterized protein
MASPLFAQARAIDTLFPAEPVGYVNDFAGILDPGSFAGSDTLIRRLKQATGAELVVVTLPNIDPYEAADVALAIGRRWKVGPSVPVGDSTRNAGAILLVVPRQNHKPGTGQVRIESGQGLEGIVTDVAAGRIRSDVMRPELDREAYGPAILKGVQALAGLIARGYGVTDTTLTAYQPVQNPGDSRSVGSSILPLLLFLVFMLIVSRRGRRRRSGLYWGGPWIGGGWGGGGGFGGGGGGFGGFGGGGGFSGGGAGGRF